MIYRSLLVTHHLSGLTFRIAGRSATTMVTNSASLARGNVGGLSGQRLALISLLAWLAMIGLDFFLHGGLLAGLYTAPAAFLLPPAQAFSRIPLGYAGFFLL